MGTEIYINPRIELPFESSYDGRNQFILTGGIDDLFLIRTREKKSKLCTIDEAMVEYGKKKNYDFIITVVNGGEKLLFSDPNQEAAFENIVHGKTAAPANAKVRPSKLRPREGDAPAPVKEVRKAAEEAETRISAQGDNNKLAQITRLLKESAKKSLVIFPYPEKMIQASDADANTAQKIEIVTKDWRNIIQTAHPDTRTVLIINPHRMEQFQTLEHYVSCFDHNSRIITIGEPNREEIAAYVKKYTSENAIKANPRDIKRVVLTGQSRAEGQQSPNLQNIVSWIQGFYLVGDKNDNSKKTLEALLAAENKEAAESKEDLLEKLDKMIGLQEVKREIGKIVADAETNKNSDGQNYHMFFLGNPGTGKTEVANIIARLFWAMELRPSRKCVSITIQDIVGEYNEGEAIQKMKNKVREAMGGVLFIDEAYLFAESEWGAKAFQTLLTEMENNRDTLTVILAGYEERLQKLKDINPGIDSRIPLKLHFQDYSSSEKLEIFNFFLDKSNAENKRKRVLTEESKEKLLRIFDRLEGNARGVRNLLEKVLKEVATDEEILPKHISDPHEINGDEVDKIMKKLKDDFVGMEEMKKQLQHYIDQVRFHIDRNERLHLKRSAGQTYRLRFTGPPGTGKTSIARLMGKFFKALGICETDACIERGATDLKGAYVGHAQQAVNSLFHENRGKVIFIDEIYSLYNPKAGQDDSFGREAVDTLVRCLTAEEYRDTVVIVAGYKNEVDTFMEANPGLASRIPTEIEFQDYSEEDCWNIFKRLAERAQYQVAENCKSKLTACFAKRKNQGNEQRFGNARTVESVLDEVVSNMIKRLKEKKTVSDDDYRNIICDDIPEK